MNVAVPMVTFVVKELDVESFGETVTLNVRPDADPIPLVAPLSLSPESADASQGQPGGKVSVNDVEPPCPEMAAVAGEISGVQTTGDARSILLTKAVLAVLVLVG